MKTTINLLILLFLIGSTSAFANQNLGYGQVCSKDEVSTKESRFKNLKRVAKKSYGKYTEHRRDFLEDTRDLIDSEDSLKCSDLTDIRDGFRKVTRSIKDFGKDMSEDNDDNYDKFWDLKEKISDDSPMSKDTFKSVYKECNENSDNSPSTKLSVILSEDGVEEISDDIREIYKDFKSNTKDKKSPKALANEILLPHYKAYATCLASYQRAEKQKTAQRNQMWGQLASLPLTLGMANQMGNGSMGLGNPYASYNPYYGYGTMNPYMQNMNRGYQFPSYGYQMPMQGYNAYNGYYGSIQK